MTQKLIPENERNTTASELSSTSTRRSAGSVLAIFIGLSLLLATASFGAYYFFWKGPQALAGGTTRVIGEMAKEVGKVMGGKVIIGRETVYGPAAKITEITTAENTFKHTYSYQTSWLGSKKTIKLEGRFTAKAGFKVNDDFAIIISEDGETLTLQHREPELLSCELEKVKIVEDKNGFWNKLKPEEREAAQNQLIQGARERGLTEDLHQKATENLNQRLAPLQKKYQFELTTDIIP